MQNFTFYSPTEFVFGKESETRAGQLIKKYNGEKVLVHYGGGSVVKSGLLNRVTESLAAGGIDYIALGGAQPNPIDTLVYEGINLCRKEQVDFILAIGGGSCIDSAKAIAMGALYDGDFWDFYDEKAYPCKALPVATVLTIPAAGSEGSAHSVITKVEGKLKRGFGSPLLRPVFSIMNPVLTFTLPPYQTACGIVDMMAHIIERYFSPTPNVEVTDRLSEGLLLAIIHEAPKLFANPEDYDARANIMWAGMLAHNGLCGTGNVEDWASHMMEHELSALYNVAHGAGLAVMIPAWMKYVINKNADKAAQFATRVWGVEESGDPKAAALEGVNCLIRFLQSISMPVTFEELGASRDDIDSLVDKLRVNAGSSFGGYVRLDMENARKIYRLACASNHS